MKTFIATLAAILTAYIVIHWNDAENARRAKAALLLAEARAINQSFLDDLDARLPHAGPIQCQEMLRLAQTSRENSLAHLATLTSASDRDAEAIAAEDKYRHELDERIVELKRGATPPPLPPPVIEPNPIPAPPPEKQRWKPSGTALDQKPR